MIEFKRSKKSRSKNALFNPYKNGISEYDMAYLSSKKVLKNKTFNLKNNFQKDPYLNLISIYKSEKGDFKNKIKNLIDNLNISKPFLIHKELDKYIGKKTDILRNISIYEREVLKIIVRLIFEEKYINTSELEGFMKNYIYKDYVHATNEDSFKNILKTKLISEPSLNNNDIKKAHMEAYKEDLKKKIDHYESLYNKYEDKRKDNLIPKIQIVKEKLKKKTDSEMLKDIINKETELNKEISDLKNIIEQYKEKLLNNNLDYSKIIDEIENYGKEAILKIKELIKYIENIGYYEIRYNQFEHEKKDILIPRVKAIITKIQEESTIARSRFHDVKDIIDNTIELNKKLIDFKSGIEQYKEKLLNNNQDYSAMIDKIEENGEKFIQEIDTFIQELKKDIRMVELILNIVKLDSGEMPVPEPAPHPTSNPPITLNEKSSILGQINTL